MENRVTGDVSGAVAQIGTVQGSVNVGVPWIPPTPRELPPPVERFTNRVSELASLERAYQRGSRVVVVMGLGGVGKTSVTVEFAHRVANDFPDGQIVLDLGGGSATPVPVGEVLSSVLRRLGVGGEALPVSVADRAALLRSLTHGRRLLIVAENAEDTAQIRALIPVTSGSLPLVTSRVRMPALIGNGARWVPVDPLATAGATALLARLLPDDLTSHPALPALAAVCCGMPLAVCAVAGLLSLDPGHSPDTVLSTLTRHYQHHAASGRPLTEVSMYAGLDAAVAELTPSGAPAPLATSTRPHAHWPRSPTSKPPAGTPTPSASTSPRLPRSPTGSTADSPSQSLLRGLPCTHRPTDLPGQPQGRWWEHTAVGPLTDYAQIGLA